MSKATRSNTVLPGNIHDYLLENMTGRESQDATIQALLATMTKTLENLCDNKSVSSSGSYTRIEDCPIKRKSSSLDSWLQEVLLWDECYSDSGKAQLIGTKKYLKFLESVYKSENCDELISLVRVEFVENESFDKKKATVVKDAVTVIKNKLGKSDLEKCTDAWLEFINLKQDVNESAVSYVTKFEKIESQLRNVSISIPDKALAIHLLSRSNMDPQSKENVLTKTKLDSDKEIYTSMKTSIREMKGKLTQPGMVIENSTFWGESSSRRNYFKSKPVRSNSRSSSRNRGSDNSLNAWRGSVNTRGRDISRNSSRRSGSSGSRERRGRYQQSRDRRGSSSSKERKKRFDQDRGSASLKKKSDNL